MRFRQPLIRLSSRYTDWIAKSRRMLHGIFLSSAFELPYADHARAALRGIGSDSIRIPHPIRIAPMPINSGHRQQ